MVYLIFLLYVGASALGMVLIKHGGKLSVLQYNNHSLTIQIHALFASGIFLYILSFILWIYILQKFQLSLISPIAYGLTFVAIAVLSIFILNENMTVLQIIGTVIIIVGVFIASLGSK